MYAYLPVTLVNFSPFSFVAQILATLIVWIEAYPG